MARIRCVLGPMTDCEFYGGNGWCERSCIEAVTSWEDNAPVICKMRKRQPTWLDDIPNCPCVAIPSRRFNDVLREADKKLRGTEEEGTMLRREQMLNCVLGEVQRQDCVNNGGLGKGLVGKCKLNYVSGHMLTGKESCDQYREEPRRCDVCNSTEGPFREVRCGNVLCARCFNVRNRFADNQADSRIVDMLKALVARARENA